jgi:hypothetical protein
VNGESATDPRRMEARASGEFRALSQPSSGYPAGPLVQFAVAPVRGFPKSPRVGQQHFVYIVNQPLVPKEQSSLQIRFLAEEKARQVLALGEEQSRLGNRQHALELVERALELGGSAAVFATAIKTCIELDRIDLARKWAAQGRIFHPEDQCLTRWHRLLSPPTVRAVEATETTKSEEVRWLESHSQEYRGKWIVVLGTELLGFGSTLTEALRMARSKGSTIGALTHRVRD